jgi:hypothetical protein
LAHLPLAAAEELLRGEDAELRLSRARRATGEPEVVRGRLAPKAPRAERRRGAKTDLVSIDREVPGGLEDALEPEGRARERAALAGPARRSLGVGEELAVRARSIEVLANLFGRRRGEGGKRPREREVDDADLGLIDVAGELVARPIVDRSEHRHAAMEHLADPPLRLEASQRARDVAHAADGALEDLPPHGMTREGEDHADLARLRVERAQRAISARHPREDHRVPVRRVEAPRRVAAAALNEGLARMGIEAAERELGLEERGQVRLDVPNEGALRPLILADEEEHEDPRPAHETKGLGQYAGAVGVRPLELIEDEDDRALAARSVEALRECATERAGRRRRRFVLAGGRALGLRGLEVAIVPEQERHRLVEGVEGAVLVLVGDAREDERRLAPRLEPRDEAPHEGALADPRGPDDLDRARSPRRGRLVVRVEERELPFTPEEDLRKGRLRRGIGAEDREHVFGRGARRGSPREETLGERSEPQIDGGDLGRERGRVFFTLAAEHLVDGPREREGARERLVEHDAEGIPIAGRGGGPRVDELGRDIGRGTVDRDLGRARGGGHQPEVDELHEAVIGYEHVRRLHVAVDETLAVERVERVRELREVRPREVRAARRRDAIEHVVEVPPSHVGHHQEGGRAARVELQRRDDVGVREIAEPAIFALEGEARPLVPEHLHGDVPARVLVAREEDHPVPPRAELPEQAKAIAEAVADAGKDDGDRLVGRRRFRREGGARRAHGRGSAHPRGAFHGGHRAERVTSVDMVPDASPEGVHSGARPPSWSTPPARGLSVLRRRAPTW